MYREDAEKDCRWPIGRAAGTHSLYDYFFQSFNFNFFNKQTDALINETHCITKLRFDNARGQKHPRGKRGGKLRL